MSGELLSHSSTKSRVLFSTSRAKMSPQPNRQDEREPLLQNGHVDGGEGGDSREIISFSENDASDPRQWTKRRKMTNVGIIALMASMLHLSVVCKVMG